MNIDLQGILLLIPGILAGFTFHEYAHALVADKLGDKTPRFQGRLTLNPLVHIDPMGFIAILIFHFGWAKPVETNPRAYKNFYKDDLKVSIAGPVANLMVAIVITIILQLLNKIVNIYSFNNTTTMYIILNMLISAVYINCMLFFFNLLPLPGLDGFHVFRDIFPKVFNKISGEIYRYQMFILLVFIITPLPGYLVVAPAIYLNNVLLRFVGL